MKTLSPPVPKQWCVSFTYHLVQSPYFDWVIFVLVLIDIILIIVQLSIMNDDATIYFRYINCAFVGIYTSEAILKVHMCVPMCACVGARRH